jgi:site-specific recombinase XerD
MSLYRRNNSSNWQMCFFVNGKRVRITKDAAASLFASGGCDIITLKNLLGHNTVAVTQQHAHPMPGWRNWQTHGT